MSGEKIPISFERKIHKTTLFRVERSEPTGERSRNAHNQEFKFSIRFALRLRLRLRSARYLIKKPRCRSAPWHKRHSNDRYRSMGALRESILLWLCRAVISRSMECVSFLQDFLAASVCIRRRSVVKA